MTKNIVLVGCGNIGSRHIQALTKLPFKITLHLVEPSLESQNLTKSRLDEISLDNIDELVWHSSVEEPIPKSDLTIIATQSIGRADLIKNLLENGHSRFLIEKIVCQSTEEYKLLNSKFQEFDAKGWINTNRRYMEPYRQLKDSIKDESASISNPKLKATDCLPEQRNVDGCIEIYQPVCGQVQIECITTPCNPVKETFENSCKACINTRVISYTGGECLTDKEIKI